MPTWTVGEDPAPFFTSPYLITKDPETGVRNVGTYRMQVKGPNKTGLLIGKRQDMALAYVQKQRPEQADAGGRGDRRRPIDRLRVGFEDVRRAR